MAQTTGHSNVHILGQNRKILSGSKIGFQPLCSSTMAPVGGFAHLFWDVVEVVEASDVSTPRVKIGWQSYNQNGLETFELICDAWFGELGIFGSDFSIQIGYATGDEPGGSYTIQGSITDASTAGSEYATFTRRVVSLANGGTETVLMPGDGTRASRVRRFMWCDVTGATAVPANVEIRTRDFSGREVQMVRTGATPAHPNAAGTTEYIVYPGAKDMVVLNRSGDTIENGRLLYFYR